MSDRISTGWIADNDRQMEERVLVVMDAVAVGNGRV
jgi:hypothetical protein